MGKFEKAVDFHLRGFNSEYIKRRTGISMQSLVKQLSTKGVKYTKDDIANHQVAYIRDKYTVADIDAAYQRMVEQHNEPHKASRRGNVVMLGCGFGDYPRVLKAILGDAEYLELERETRTKQRSKITI